MNTTQNFLSGSLPEIRTVITLKLPDGNSGYTQKRRIISSLALAVAETQLIIQFIMHPLNMQSPISDLCVSCDKKPGVSFPLRPASVLPCIPDSAGLQTVKCSRPCRITLYETSVCQSGDLPVPGQFFLRGIRLFQIPPHDGHPVLRLAFPAARHTAHFHLPAVTNAGYTRKKSRCCPNKEAAAFRLFTAAAASTVYCEKISMIHEKKPWKLLLNMVHNFI